MRPVALELEEQLLRALLNAAESKHRYIEYLHISKVIIFYIKIIWPLQCKTKCFNGTILIQSGGFQPSCLMTL